MGYSPKFCVKLDTYRQREGLLHKIKKCDIEAFINIMLSTKHIDSAKNNYLISRQDVITKMCLCNIYRVC